MAVYTKVTLEDANEFLEFVGQSGAETAKFCFTSRQGWMAFPEPI